MTVPDIVGDVGIHAGGTLTVDLDAIATNFRTLQAHVGSAICGAVVKADAYGLGVARVAPALYAAGCRSFFVAHVDEGIALRSHLPAQAHIYVLHGPLPGSEVDCVANRLVPILNSLEQLAAWAAVARLRGSRLPGGLQVDTGMARLGLSPRDVEIVRQRQDDLSAIELRLVMSHLACADNPTHPANEAQRAAFAIRCASLPPVPASLSASSGIFLGKPYHHDMVRPGAALFGVAPRLDRPNPMLPVVRLDARVIQVRDVPSGTPVGYGHIVKTTSPARLVTIAMGYADGYLRSGVGRGAAWFCGTPLPIVGRISMDSIVLDATRVPQGAIREGASIEIIGEHRDIGTVAAELGTIGYEVLTSLRHRYHRRYVTGGKAAA